MKRRQAWRDPYAKREAENYARPVPSRELIAKMLRDSSAPMTHPEICREFKLGDEESVEALRRRLIAMERDGQLVSNRRRAYGLIEKMDMMRGRVVGHRDGFGFVSPGDGADDLFLNNRQMQGVFDGDEVVARVVGVDRRGRKEGRIVEILERNTWELVGRYYTEYGIGYVAPENPRISQDILIDPKQTGDAKDGQFVVVEVTSQPTWKKQPMGRVAEVIGDHMAPGMEIDVAIRSYDIPNEWPEELLAEAARLPDEVAEEDKVKRVDLRKLPLLTIDGEDARDFDDAVYCEKKKGGGWRLWVAIADVSHYVAVRSALDNEAVRRGNSVYFPERVVPMLPEALSNGLCSINPGVDRLCMVCEMTISAAGRLSGYVFYEGVMHSHARMTYTKVGKILEDRSTDNPLRKQYAKVVPHLEQLHALYIALREARSQRGAIEFETTETRIIFGADRKIESIVPVQRNDAHKLIEECMLCANVAAARFLEKQGLPALYRVHDGPRDQKLANLREYLGGLGLDLGGGDKPTPGDFQDLLASLAQRPDAALIQTMMLRSMSQAAYQADNRGHFGLNYPAYTHFTSPIRRYSDLLTHRAIRHVIRSRQSSDIVRRVRGAKVMAKRDIYPYQIEDIAYYGEQTSMTERRADEATRDVVSWLKCEYLEAHVGDEFNGVVTAVTGFGLFVELKDVYVEGLIHVTALENDYYHFDTARQCLLGERSGKVYGLGDELVVRVARVNLDERKIDLELLAVVSSVRRKKSRKSSKADDRATGKSKKKKLARHGQIEELEKPRKRKGKGSKNTPAKGGKKSGKKQKRKS